MERLHGCFCSLMLIIAIFTCVASNVSAACYNGCKFSFCPSQSEYAIGAPDVAITGAICDPSGKVAVGHVDETGEAQVYSYRNHVPISKYSPSGLRQAFSPSFFKSYGLQERSDLSGVGHETPQQNQVDYLGGLCVVLPLSAYQVLDKPGGYVVDNIHPRNSVLTDCVAFTTVVNGKSSGNGEGSTSPPTEPITRRTSANVSTPGAEVESTTARTQHPSSTDSKDETITTKQPLRSTEKPKSNQTEVQTPPPIDKLPVVECSEGCPATSVIKPIHDKCKVQLGDRAKDDYWIFGGLNGESSNGKDCALINMVGIRVCEGTFQHAEWCNDGFVCSGGSSYRPQIVQCVTAGGGLCKLSDHQTDDILLEHTTGANGVFVSCPSH